MAGYDYSAAGMYFVTLCAQGRRCLFGDVIGDSMFLSPAAVMLHRVWKSLPACYPSVSLDEFIVMPNHLHGIVVLEPTNQGPSLSGVVGRFKAATTTLYARGVTHEGWPLFNQRLWQRGFHDHIIRTESALANIRQYIRDNPRNWANDENNPARTEQHP